MDTTEKPFTAVEWCAGYAGIHLGLKRVIPNMRVIAFSEIEAFACANLVAKMEAGHLDPAPIWPDLKTFPCGAFADKVDVLMAGFPCQPFSCAGLRKGDDDPRHLWPYIAEGITTIQPRFVFLENVEGLISAKLGSDCWADPIGTPVLLHVLRELERRGYTPTWGVFSASETGAPHQRKRVFILAHSSSEGLQGLWKCGRSEGREAQAGYTGSSSNLWPSRPGEPQYWWEPPRVTGGQTQSPLGGDAVRSAGGMDYAELCESCDNRVDELRLLGNGVVPATAAKAWEVLYERLCGK